MAEENLAGWMKWCYDKNREAFTRRLSAADTVDWSRKGIQVGPLCLNPLFESVVCFVAGDNDLAARFLDLSQSRIVCAHLKFGTQSDLDQKGIDRAQIALAARWLANFREEDTTELPPVPFDVFPRHLASLAEVDLNNAVRICWGFMGLLDGNSAEYREALRSGVRVHRDLKDEMSLLGELPGLTTSTEANDWKRFRTVMTKWIDPRNDSESYATNYQLDFSFLFVLFWATFRLHASGPDALLSVFRG